MLGVKGVLRPECAAYCPRLCCLKREVCGRRLAGRAMPILGNCSSAQGSVVLSVCGWPAPRAGASVLGPGHLCAQPGCRSEQTPCFPAGPSLGGVGLALLLRRPHESRLAVVEALGMNEFRGVEVSRQHLFWAALCLRYLIEPRTN